VNETSFFSSSNGGKLQGETILLRGETIGDTSFVLSAILMLLLLTNEDVDVDDEIVDSLFLRCNDKFKPGSVVKDILT
jgi:hypothetical protein